MIKRIFLLLYVMFLFESLQICKAQKTTGKISIENMPAFVKELQQDLPSVEMMYNDPKRYQQLLKRRQELCVQLINAVKQHQLPETALQFLRPYQNINNNNINTNTLVDKITAGNFHLVKDINQAKNSYPENRNGNRSGVLKNYAVLNNIVYYAADDGIHGIELWRSNGTDTGTYMVKNIAAGNSSSYVNEITIFKNKIYFSAYTEVHGYALYQSDGTTTGTILLKGISEVSNLITANDKLYFTAYESELWKTDGTSKGTVLVKDLYDSLNAYNIQQLINVNDKVFFTAYDYSHGTELWCSDGTATGTHMIKDINPDNTDYGFNGPMNLTSYNGKLYFSAYDGNARTLWKSDGTSQGTKSLIHNDVQVIRNPEVSLGRDKSYAIVKGALYFAGYTASTGIDLYKYDFSTASITLIKTISSSKTNVSFYSESICSMNDSIYFSISNTAGTGYDLWKSGGASINTKIIKSFTGAIDRYNFYALGKELYFSVHTTESGNEPWISDGTSAGTKLLKDINTGVSSSNPAEFTQCSGKIYFSAYSLGGGIELWKTDGTSANTKQVKDINATSTASALGDSKLINLNANEIIFPAFTPDAGTEFWKSDGTESGTKLIKDLVPGEAYTYPTIYESKNGKAYFSVYNDTTTFNDIYVTDGTALGTKKIATVTGSINELHAADNGIVFYTMYDYQTGDNQLWRTDNTGNNFMLSLNIVNINGDEMGVAGNICYFSYGINEEVWKSDGTISGTKILSNNIHDGYWYTALGNKIIFMANGSPQYGLWISDGTAAGTIFLKNMSVNINAGSAILNNKLYFNGNGDLKGNELYKTDGTSAGTVLVKDINPEGFNSSNPINLITVKKSVYFTVTGINNQTELWKTSGNKASTQLIKILSLRNLETHDINNFTSAGGKLYFIDSTQLWVSDGTDTGTHVIIDPSNITSVYSLAAAGNKLFFNAYSYNYGYELYEGDGTLGTSKTESNAISKTLNKPSFSAQLLANPFTDYISISINSPLKQQLQITIINTAGQVLTAKAININTGYNLITLDAAKYLHDVYVIDISSSSRIISLKAVK